MPSPVFIYLQLSMPIKYFHILDCLRAASSTFRSVFPFLLGIPLLIKFDLLRIAFHKQVGNKLC